MPVFRCSGILFDLDGVLVDSTRSVTYQWLAWADEHNIPAEVMLPIMHGRRTVEVVQLAAPQLDAESEALSIERKGATDFERISAVPGAKELLTGLPADRWAVVTSATRFIAGPRLQHFHMPLPRVMVTADDVSHGKPHPAPYLRGAALLGVAPEECIVIEDSPAGIVSAHAGGMKAIGLTTTFPASELRQADAVIPAMAQIRVSVLPDGKLQLEC